MGKLFQKTLMIFQRYSDFWIKIVKMMWPRVALGLILNTFLFYLGASLTVLNPDFTGVIRKSVNSFKTVGLINRSSIARVSTNSLQVANRVFTNLFHTTPPEQLEQTK